MINFGVVFVVLYIFALKPLSKLMAERKEKIEKGIDDAKQNAEILQKTNAEYEKALAKARAEADAIFKEGKKEAEAKKAAMMENAKLEVATMIENGKKTLQSEKTKMVEDAKAEIVTLAMHATEKLLGSKGDASFNQKALRELQDLQ